MLLQDLDPVDAQGVAALLDEALNLPSQQRAAWQTDLERRAPKWHALVAALLATLTEPGGLEQASQRLETADLIGRRMARAAAAADVGLEGRRFGPYRVLRLLGQGGMGSVWLAERADGLFERQVALKLVHLSLASSTLRERFARERGILAALDHPRIAKLLDAGVEQGGQPYLAIEYVDGWPLTEFCDTHHLGLLARIELMLKVTEAVQYAHQNLVIHRDLKPANILVTRDGDVRLLDFGIAKLMSQGQAQETELTQLGGRVLTPDYASPEQIAGRAISTASDVYSLGVLLYVLLCGQQPYRLPRESRAALEEAILSTQPVRPSQQTPSAEIAQARATTPKKLVQALTGDLDTIVLKSLKKDPVDRYATADALMQDLQRHLAGRPVQARPDSAVYRLTKFIRRHQLQVGVGLAAGVFILGAAAVSVWQGQIARAQEALARQEAQRAQAVQGFLLDIFKANTVQQSDPIRARQTTARELLDVGAQRVAQQLKDAPLAQVEVLNTLADMYVQLGLEEDAGRLRQQSIAVLKQVYGTDDARVADALLAYARDVSETTQRATAQAALDETLQILDRIADQSSRTRGWVSIESANIQQYLSIAAMRQHADDAVRHFRAQPSRWTDLFHALQAAARARYLAGDFAGAQALHRAALAEVDRHAGDGAAAWAITPTVQLAEAQIAELQVEQAVTNFRAALNMARQVHGDLGGVTLQTQAKVGAFLHTTGQRDEGMKLLDDAHAAIGRPDANATPNAVAAVHRFRGIALLGEGRVAEAEAALATEVDDLRQHYPESLPLSRTLLLQAAALTALGRYDASRAALDEAWRLWRATGGDAVQPAAHNRYRLERAQLLLAQRDTAGAEQELQAIAPANTGAQLRLDETRAQLSLAHARLLQGRAQDARILAQAALDHVRSSPLRPHYPRLEAEAALRLGQAVLNQSRAQGGANTARTLMEHAFALRQKTDAPESPWLAEAKMALADCLSKLGERKAARALFSRV